MANGLQLNVSTPVTGLGTQTFTVTSANAGAFTCGLSFTIPYKASGMPGDSSVTTGGSSLSIVVNVAGTPVYTLSNPTPTQPSLSGSVSFTATAGQDITVVTSSSDPDDIARNAVKGIVNLYQGVR